MFLWDTLQWHILFIKVLLESNWISCDAMHFCTDCCELLCNASTAHMAIGSFFGGAVVPLSINSLLGWSVVIPSCTSSSSIIHDSHRSLSLPLIVLDTPTSTGWQSAHVEYAALHSFFMVLTYILTPSCICLFLQVILVGDSMSIVLRAAAILQVIHITRIRVVRF